jgi:UDP-N-acetylmuramoyl-L-alanyl-D-glutamate--2,6-diaminopimelate ligase
MALLREILYQSGIQSVHGPLDIVINDVQIDSRKITPSSLFIAIKGLQFDGHAHIDQAIRSGAAAIVLERLPDQLDPSITWIQVTDSAAAAGFIAHHFYGEPSEKLYLVGVTGTNGKTTIATLLYKLFTALGYRCGLISTVKVIIGSSEHPATHTTPDPIQLNHTLQMMVAEGCSHVFMETSSHAIHQQRIAGLKYAGGVFSNITHDHLDYHKTFDEYIRVKKMFFDGLSSAAFAISNADDKRGAVMLQNTKARRFFYSLRTMAEFKAKILENGLAGLVMVIGDKEVHFRLIGEFNAYNLLAVYATAVCLQEDKEEVLRCMSELTGAEGRFDYSVSEKEKQIGIIDYAHTPDALENVLTTIRNLRTGAQQIITVVGCGGDRDKTKRPLMAQVAADLSDKVFLTSDNPRSEDPAAIIQDMEQGLNTAGKRKTIALPDRKEAIKAAVAAGKAGDILLIAGKGHEKYQEIKGVKYPFDDKEVLNEMWALFEK